MSPPMPAKAHGQRGDREIPGLTLARQVNTQAGPDMTLERRYWSVYR